MEENCVVELSSDSSAPTSPTQFDKPLSETSSRLDLLINKYRFYEGTNLLNHEVNGSKRLHKEVLSESDEEDTLDACLTQNSNAIKNKPGQDLLTNVFLDLNSNDNSKCCQVPT